MRRLLPVVLLSVIALAVACGGDSSTPTASPSPSPKATGFDIYPGGGVPNYATPFGGTQAPFPFSTPELRTMEPGVPIGYHSFEGNEPLPDIPAGAAVYLSLGDSINYGCCADIQLSSHPRLAYYISQKLNRPVVWVSLAGNGTLQSFLHGIGGQAPQLDNAVALISQLRSAGHDVVLISLSIGGNDLLALRQNMGCQGGGQPECVNAFNDLMNSYNTDMETVYSKLNAAKDPGTPIFQNTIYDAQDCGGEGSEITTSAVAVKVYNQRMEGATRVGGSFLVDFYEPFKGKGCEYVSGVDPTYSGYDVILGLDEAKYDSLPAAFVDPWKR